MLDSPGIMMPRVPDHDAGMRLALVGAYQGLGLLVPGGGGWAHGACAWGCPPWRRRVGAWGVCLA